MNFNYFEIRCKAWLLNMEKKIVFKVTFHARFFFFSIIYGSAKKPNDIKEIKEDRQISAGLS